MRGFIITGALLAATAVAAQQAPAPAPATAPVTAIKAGRLVVDAGRPALGPSTVLVQGGRIVAVQAGSAPIPAGARVVDLSRFTVLPGLIDAHVHLTSDPGTPYTDEAVRSDEHAVAVGLKNAALTLRAGFTTVRDLGSSKYTGFAVRDAIREGLMPGPRVLAAGPAISIIGGHGDVSGFRDDVNHVLTQDNTCTGAVECAARVREASKRGADVIKITATGGVLSQQGRGLGQHFTSEEIRSIVETARSLGLKVASHAHGAAGVIASANEGCASVEHGVFADAAAVAAMAKNRTWYVPTLMALQGLSERLGKGVYTPTVEAKVRETLAVRGRALGLAVKAGVPVAFGTDAGVFEHGRNGEEFAQMVRFGGMTQQAALVAATTGAASLLGLSDEVGTIEAGKSADIIAVDGDPQADPAAMTRVRFAMSMGRIAPPPAE